MFPLDHFHFFISMPKPMTESHESQLFSLLRKIPIRDFRLRLPSGLVLEHWTLKPSFLQLSCNEAPFMSDIHSARPTFVLR